MKEKEERKKKKKERKKKKKERKKKKKERKKKKKERKKKKKETHAAATAPTLTTSSRRPSTRSGWGWMR